jgi:hypothetical protein
MTRRNSKLKFSFSIIYYLLLITFFLCACVGVSTDVALKADGSGTAVLEYRVSHALNDLGKLDGNERWPTVPVGKADFERTARRLEGVRLGSVSSHDDGTDTVTNVKFSFANMDALVDLLDATGQRASFDNENGRNRLSLVLTEKSDDIDSDMLSLLEVAAEGYDFSFALALPQGASIAHRLRDGDGRQIDIEGTAAVVQGGKISVSIPMSKLLAVREGVTMEITW